MQPDSPTPPVGVSAARERPGDRAPSDAARFWDRAAREYAASPFAVSPGFENSLRRTRGLLSPEQVVLEVGCGTGTAALQLAPSTRHSLATDFSPQMIAIAREKLAAQPVAPLRFGVFDLETARLEPESFHTVIAFNVLHLIHDLDAVLDALRRALRPGGRLISKAMYLEEMNPLIPQLTVSVMRWLGKAPATVQSFDATTLEAALMRSGFVVEAVERHGTRRKDPRAFIVAHRP